MPVQAANAIEGAEIIGERFSQIEKRVLLQSLEQSNVALTISRVDGDWEILYANQKFLVETGYALDDVIGRNCRFLQGEGTDPNTVKLIHDMLVAFKPLDTQILNYKKDGTPFWSRLRLAPVFDEQKQPIAFIGQQLNITQIKEANLLEQERQKIEALGRMTGNISHEIKNALQPIKLMTEMLRDWKTLEQSQIERCMEILSENVVIADKITHDVLRFSRKSDSDVHVIRTEDLKDDILRFVRNLVHTHVSFESKAETEQCSPDCFVTINQNQLYQILINLVGNAQYAMKDSGTLTLYWSCGALDPVRALDLGLISGAYLCIGIQDTGSGMDDRTIRSCFDPFYSTKPPGEGTGIGLSISNRIVKEWKGSIVVDSEVGVGSKFSIYIPVKIL
jgi:PAS domain S-box-containing protein